MSQELTPQPEALIQPSSKDFSKKPTNKRNKNLFGIKWTGKCAPSITVEKGLNCPSNEQGGARPYNRYKSYSDSMVDHGWFLGKNRKRYGPTLDATTPEQQIKELGKSGYGEASTYASSLQNMINKYNLTKYNTASTNTPSGDAGKGEGDGKTYMVQPQTTKVRHNGPTLTRADKATYANAKREIDKLNRQITTNMHQQGSSGDVVRGEYINILAAIVDQLQAINNNTADTARGVNNIEIVSANEPVSTGGGNRPNKKPMDPRQANSNTGYDIARKMASYK